MRRAAPFPLEDMQARRMISPRKALPMRTKNALTADAETGGPGSAAAEAQPSVTAAGLSERFSDK